MLSNLLRPRKPKAPIRIDTEQSDANSRYYTAFKVILKITVIALVICIAFLPAAALRNKHRQHSGDPLVKELEHPIKFDISTELERHVTHVPVRFVKSAKFLVQQLRNRDTTSDDLTNLSANDQVKRTEQVADDNTDGIQYGDHTLGGSIHQAKAKDAQYQECTAEIKRRNEVKCPQRPTLPIRDDDRVLSESCSWQARRKHGGRCDARQWRATPRSSIVSQDVATSPLKRSDKEHFNQERSTSLTSKVTSTTVPKSTRAPEVINTCSYESAVKNGGRCPHGLVNGQKPADNQPLTITVKIESREPGTEHQPREAAVSGDTQVQYKPYKAEVCKPRWVRTTDGWCMYQGSWGPDEEKPIFYSPQSKRSVSSEQQRLSELMNEDTEDQFWRVDPDLVCLLRIAPLPGPYERGVLRFSSPDCSPETMFPKPPEKCVTLAYMAASRASCPGAWIYEGSRCSWYKKNVSRRIEERSGSRDKITSLESVQTPVVSTLAHASTFTSTSTSAPTSGACQPPWIRTMDGRCFFDPNYQREHPQDPLDRPQRPTKHRRGEFVSDKRDVAPSWQGSSCPLPWIRSPDGWCLYRPVYKHGTQNALPGAPDVVEKPTVTEQASTTQAASTTQPTATKEADITVPVHCITDLHGRLHCIKFADANPQHKSVHSRRGFWPDDWVPQIVEDCDRFVGDSYTHYQCLQSVKHKNVGLKLIMVFLILAGFGSLIFLIITCVNRAARPKAHPFRQSSGIVNSNGMLIDHQYAASMCSNYPWNTKAARPMSRNSWARSPPAYDPMRLTVPNRSNSHYAPSASSASNENWIRKLCNRCFGTSSHNSSTEERMSQLSGVVGNEPEILGARIHGLRSDGSRIDGHRIDTLKLPNANLSTVRRANGLVLSEENGHVGASRESAETVVVGSDRFRGSGSGRRGSGSAVGLHRGSSAASATSSVGGYDATKAEAGLTTHGNLSGDTVVEPEAPMVMTNTNASPNGSGFGNGNLKMGCLKMGGKKVGFGGLEELPEVSGSWEVDRVEPLRVEKENLMEMQMESGVEMANQEGGKFEVIDIEMHKENQNPREGRS